MIQDKDIRMEPQTHTSNNTVNPAAATARGLPTRTPTGSRLTSIHVTALDGIVNVNSLFTVAIFIGLSLTTPEAGHAGSRPECTASRETIRRLIVFEVVSFSFFLFSSLIAQSLKLAISLINNMDPTDPHKANIDLDVLKYGLFGSATGSIIACIFLMLSIVDFIQVKLGVQSCGGKTVYAITTLVTFVGFGILVYASTAVYVSFFVEVRSHQEPQN